MDKGGGEKDQRLQNNRRFQTKNTEEREGNHRTTPASTQGRGGRQPPPPASIENRYSHGNNFDEVARPPSISGPNLTPDDQVEIPHSTPTPQPPTRPIVNVSRGEARPAQQYQATPEELQVFVDSMFYNLFLESQQENETLRDVHDILRRRLRDSEERADVAEQRVRELTRRMERLEITDHSQHSQSNHHTRGEGRDGRRRTTPRELNDQMDNYKNQKSPKRDR